MAEAKKPEAPVPMKKILAEYAVKVVRKDKTLDIKITGKNGVYQQEFNEVQMQKFMKTNNLFTGDSNEFMDFVIFCLSGKNTKYDVTFEHEDNAIIIIIAVKVGLVPSKVVLKINAKTD
mmetsp:Transcript_53006/g.64968  ORF Transcript_53006/g.64968 Transcript_53006/m.64968 type:complete len:119 (+) Transcript_53006:35-391(+)